MHKTEKIFVAGHKGLVGSTIVRKLAENGFVNVLTRTKEELDLIDQSAVKEFFKLERPGYVILSAARVGGILANSTYSADFIYENLEIACNIIKSASEIGVKKLINFGSSCMYPKFASQPMKEEYLMSGPVESTSESYAIAKISGIKLCRYFNEQYGTNFISVLPATLYGPNDNFDLNASHVIPAFIRKIYEAKTTNKDHIVNWGDGSPLREFLYVDDLADALLFLLGRYDYRDIGEFINIGSGEEITIRELAWMIASMIGYEGEILWDTSKPNGTPRKLLDSTRMTRLGWSATTDLRTGIEKTVDWFRHYRKV